ncbi:ABC transporter ATP-binding protein [Coprothermobacteraceae bacterium]|nr:ABC transporter ATP-binding protein [Coprothermobacteraceae bacterium]
MEKAIVATDLTYRYGNLTAVDHISFEVEAGEILGFLGPNGAGKTTTFKMLVGLLKPMEGTATVLGMDVTHEIKKIQRHIGVCFEYTNLYEEISALENLKLFAQLHGVSDIDLYGLLEKVGLGGKEKDRVATYSKGMKQRLMIARALVNRPKVLFLDEPTSGLDPVSAEDIRSIILEEKKRGVTVFLTTHDMHEADKLSDHVAFINQGKIVALDTPHNLKQQYGKRKVRALVERGDTTEEVEIELDKQDTPERVFELFKNERVVTMHTQEATLEDIFIQITGRGLA